MKYMKAIKRITKAFLKKQEKKSAKKALENWSLQCRAIGFCEVCRAMKGALKVNGKPKVLNAHHVIPREFVATATDPRNACCLCQECHKFNLTSAHRNALWFINWFMTHRPDDYQYLLKYLK